MLCDYIASQILMKLSQWHLLFSGEIIIVTVSSDSRVELFDRQTEKNSFSFVKWSVEHKSCIER